MTIAHELSASKPSTLGKTVAVVECVLAKSALPDVLFRVS